VEPPLRACAATQSTLGNVGHERHAIVYAAMGDHARAADFYRKTVEFVSHPDRIDDYETLHIYQEELEKQERLAGLR
jgi:hypothetical protein